jgi:hypothetical protein
MSSWTQWPAAFVSSPAPFAAELALFVSWPGVARSPTTCGGGQSKVVGGLPKTGHDTVDHDTNATFPA